MSSADTPAPAVPSQAVLPDVVALVEPPPGFNLSNVHAVRTLHTTEQEPQQDGQETLQL